MLSNTYIRKVGLCMARIPSPLEIENASMANVLGTQSGCLHWHATMANAEYVNYLSEVMGVLTDVKFLTEVGFKLDACDD